MSLGLFGPIGTTELVIILVIALMLFGGRLPDVARSIGKSVNQFKRGLRDVDEEMNRSDVPPPAPPPPRALPPHVEPQSQPSQQSKTPETTSSPQG
jgi:sec-independent protein translocase protein TatA